MAKDTAAHAPERWEYDIISSALYELPESANSLGAEGWELVSVVKDGDRRELYFKRKLRAE